MQNAAYEDRSKDIVLGNNFSVGGRRSLGIQSDTLSPRTSDAVTETIHRLRDKNAKWRNFFGTWLFDFSLTLLPFSSSFCPDKVKPREI